MNKNLDILANLEITDNVSQNTTHSFNESETIEDIFEHSQDSFFTLENTADFEEKKEKNTLLNNAPEKKEEASIHTQKAAQEIISKQNTQKGSVFSGIVFFVKYMCTSFLIFWVLMLASNYSAYGKLLYAIIYASELQQTEQSMVESVSASNIQAPKQDSENIHTFQALEKQNTVEVPHDAPNIHSLTKLITQTESKKIDLGIEITPYENRIVIPKIGKNIPLLDIENREIEGVNELNNIFMKELERGVIRYPWSALPGKNGNSFIFGHSSNFPWMEGEYNDVFALLDKLSDGDEIIVYYNQEKYTYVVSKKDVIRPGDVSVLKNTDKEKKELNLMTCWPIGTTLNRLIVSAELKSVEQQ